ncbi:MULTISPECIES: ABC transporter ATP-binding protein [Bacillus cereus group]|uniref:Oligopeptide/dipeptide ABC transporter, ATP-binding protein domain n=1 Tax=Bacillus cereus TIAC219 TaxID=718222 RepID=A0ABC9T072_BACCE|nr:MULTISPECIES: ABC transporter ATP-binding protein [Bacillus cereus group]EJP89108.1 oligopeptide/dipeptide ABC transporter, ATP-binding protein domain [Bacillus cereus VD022]EOQ65869.1 oligopeptide/dipeptide ABC transporter, ATP-binding protein domain [Bacillus cereus TIAC219]KAA0823626.1 ABC transporter ATP-binding protein [Bacillus sp. AY2-1]MCH5449667.1 ABC transporter ATP-binding protein [Bacillus cereus]MCU4778254.1 ABC transporter ATP-binding protein [Bacillus cereus]
MSEKLLEVKNLKTSFFIESGEVEAVRGVTFRLNKGEVVGIVGESGSGKSVMAKSVMSLVTSPGKVKEGEILFHNENILSKSEKELRSIRGNQISLISQDPMSALNPVVKIGKQMTEVIIRHQKVKKKEAEQIAVNLLKQVGLSSPEERVKQYPHELSGGMKQRVMIAMAMSCNPDLLIADEPTTALDVTIQAQILDLMKNLKNETNMALLLITHDLGIVAQNCTRVIVMYGGLIMEEGPVLDIFRSPNHPYTKGLLNSLPKISNGVRERLAPIQGVTPNLLNPPKGCPFAERCPHAMDICEKERPPYFEIGNERRSMCWLNDKTVGESHA